MAGNEPEQSDEEIRRMAVSVASDMTSYSMALGEMVMALKRMDIRLREAVEKPNGKREEDRSFRSDPIP